MLRNRELPERPLGHLVIRASAGTGKTFQLSLRYLALLLRDVPPDRILATTFTRKAAREILERIVTRLAEAALDDQRCRELSGHLGIAELDRADCLRALQVLLGNLHRLRIGTLDSLFAQLARAFSLEIGLPPGWRILDEAEEIALRDAAIDAMLRREETARLVSLTHLLSKGETLRGVHALIRDTVTNLHGLFRETEAGAWHAIQRPNQLAPGELDGLLDELRQTTSTDKRFQKSLTEDHGRALHGAWEEFLQTGLGAKIAAGEATYYSKPIPPAMCQLYERLLDQARAVLIQRVASQTEGSYALLRSFHEERSRLTLEQRGVRFDDITQALDAALPSREESGKPSHGALAIPGLGLAHRLDGMVSHLLLDEFQDTAPRQWRAMRSFVEAVAGGENTGRGAASFFCVGDVKQAIYGWRGGVAEIFEAVESQVPGLEQERLNKSFRSSSAVVELVNRVFHGATGHPRLEREAQAVRAWCQRFEEHTTDKADWPGYACLCTAPAPREDQTARDAVLEAAAARIAELHAQAPEREIGVLVRRNVTVARLIHLLRLRGLAASEEGGNPLTDSAAVQLVLSLLQLADHPGDTVARFHLATSPLGPAVGLTDHADDGAARHLAAATRRDLLTIGYGPVVLRVARWLRPDCGSRDRNRLDQLVERAYAYQPSATLRTRDFLRKIEFERIAEPSQAAIRVMTIHQAKGLEFDIVVLPELDDDLIGQPPRFVVERPDPAAPISRVCLYVNRHIQQLLPPRIQQMFERATSDDVVETMCLLYVALTRAIHVLHIVIPPPKTPAEKIPRTLAGIVRVALAGTQPAPPDTMLFECGDPGWLRKLASQSPAAVDAVPEPAPSPPVEELLHLAPSDRRRRGFERISPSGLEGGSSVWISRWLESGAGSAALRGTILHACLAEVGFIDEEAPEDERLSRVVADVLREHGQSGEPTPWLSEFRRVLAHPLVNARLRRGLYGELKSLGFDPAVAADLQRRTLRLTVEAERSFAVRAPEGLMTGSIDRLVLLWDRGEVVGADIVDFKTDSVPADNAAALQDRVAFYRPQLLAYRWAVGQFTRLPQQCIAARLVFVSAGRVSRIDVAE